MSIVPRIAGVGICCLDHVLYSPQPKWGDTVFVDDYLAQGGGLIGTALVASARLGARCSVLTLLGDDAAGEYILKDLSDEGIDTAGTMRISGGGSPFSFIHVDRNSGERTIFHRPGSGLKYEASTPLSVSRADALIVDDIYMDLSIAATDIARSHGIPVVADLQPTPSNRELLSKVDVLIAPQHFAREIGHGDNPDRALDAIHELGPRTAVITLGDKGWVWSAPDGRGRGEAFPVEVVDTTGAGDSFHGAFAYGLACGWNTLKCGEFASAVAALKCTKPGGRTGLPSLAQTLDFLRDSGKPGWQETAE